MTHNLKAKKKIPQVISKLMTTSYHGYSHVMKALQKRFEGFVRPKPLIVLKKQMTEHLNIVY